MAADMKKKPAVLSSRILGMKFMQKATEAVKLQEAQKKAEEQAQATAAEEAMPNQQPQQPTAAGAQGDPADTPGADAPQPFNPETAAAAPARCKIIYDRAPLPAGVAQGRRSFGPTPAAADAAAAEPATQEGVQLTDAEMAAALKFQQHKAARAAKRENTPNPYGSLREWTLSKVERKARAVEFLQRVHKDREENNPRKTPNQGTAAQEAPSKEASTRGSPKQKKQKTQDH